MELIIYGIGNREMIESDRGNYINLNDFMKFLSYLTDDDDSDVILKKITEMQENIDSRKKW